MDKLKNISIIDVEANTIEVQAKTLGTTQRSGNQTQYAHHNHFDEGYTPPELPEGFKPYQSSKAKLWLMMSSVALLAVTLSVVQNVQAKLLSQQFLAPMQTHNTYQGQKLAETMDLMSMNTLAFEKSLANFGHIVENKKALVEVETALHKQSQTSRSRLSNKEARDLLLRAGYNPSQITDEKMASFKKKYQGVDGDVDFARDVAGDFVKEEVESFVQKAKLITNIGEYIYNRIQD